MVETVHKLIVSQGRRPRSSYRRWSDEQKRQIVAESKVPGASVSIVARRHDVNANQVFQWRKKFADEGCVLKEAGLVPIHVISRSDDHNLTPRVTTGVIAIELKNGTTVRVDNNVDEVALTRVLSVIGQLP
jgi:transposase